MRRKRKPQLFVYVLCVALLTNLGMQIQNPDSNPVVEKSSQASYLSLLSNVLLAPPDPKPVLELQAFAAPAPEKYPSVHIASYSASDEPASAERTEIFGSLAELSPEPKQSVEPVPVPVYEVTAHYLNIRSDSNADSKILDVVKKGDLLEVDQPLDNGWVALKNGGYVHGRYVKHMVSQPESNLQSGQQAKDVQASLQSEDTLPTKVILKDEPDSDPNKPSSKVGADSGLTEEHIATILKNTALSGHGLEKSILEIEDEYGINAYFTIAVMKLESGNGKSKLAKNKNNLFGLNATGSNAHKNAFSFETKGDSVLKFGQLISKNYVKKGYSTVEKIARKYCPANSKWASLVLKIMKSDYKKL